MSGYVDSVNKIKLPLICVDNESTTKLYNKRLHQQVSHEYKHETTGDLPKIILNRIHQAVKVAFVSKTSTPRRNNAWWNNQLQDMTEQKHKLY